METALKMFEKEIEHAKIVANMEIDQSYVDLGLNYVLVDPSRLLQVVSKASDLHCIRTARVSGTDYCSLDHQLSFKFHQIYEI